VSGGEIKGVWDPSVEVEANGYNWQGAPEYTEASIPPLGRELTHIDLFSGCGGFSTGFEMAGFETTVALDIHPPSLHTLRRNHPHTSTILGDIRKVNAETVQALARVASSAFVVVTAGVPCQGFSLSNRKRHAADERNFLFHEFIRIARILRPTAVVLENVSGLVSTKDGQFKRDIAKAIEELGYDVHFTMLNAADFGVPQARRRVFFVGVPKGSTWLFPAPAYGAGGPPHQTVADAILGDLPPLEAGEAADQYFGAPTTEYQRSLRLSDPVLTNHRAPSHPQETIDRIAATEPGKPMYPSFKQRIRLDPTQPSPTQICGGIRPQFQFGHPTQARGLTIRERARIQSFPDNYVFEGGVTQGRVQTGNAVPPLLAQAMASQLGLLSKGEALNGLQGEGLVQALF
jgi:DNA (cytosine-5)-methyltransferase 1